MVRRRHHIHPRADRNSSPISTPVASRRDDVDRSSISDDTGATPGISATPYQDNRRFGDILNNSGLANTPQVHRGSPSQNTDTDTNSIAGPSEKTAAERSKDKEG